jgi:hypothetical protein
MARHADAHDRDTRFEDSRLGWFGGAADLIGVAVGLLLAALLLGSLIR